MSCTKCSVVLVMVLVVNVVVYSTNTNWRIGTSYGPRDAVQPVVVQIMVVFLVYRTNAASYIVLVYGT